MRPEAEALYTRGLERFATHDYAAADADLEAGYAIEPRREFLFAEGQAKRLAGDCKGAVALYQRFLTTDPAAVQVNATHIALGRCAQHLADASRRRRRRARRASRPRRPRRRLVARSVRARASPARASSASASASASSLASYAAQHDAETRLATIRTSSAGRRRSRAGRSASGRSRSAPR